RENYVVDGINVITSAEYENNPDNKYDLLICHAPNIRNHLKFIIKNEKHFRKVIFFFHGHEVVRINKVYPTPYRYQKSELKKVFRELYDIFKLNIWHYYLLRIMHKSHFVFVSNS